LSNATAGTLKVTGNLLGNTTNASQFNQYGGGFGFVTLSGTGTVGTPQQFEAMSADLGAVQAGWTKNFAYGTLSLAGSTYVKLVDLSNNASRAGAEAVYVKNLVMPSGTTLDLNGLHLYVRTSKISGTVVGGTITTVSGHAVVDQQIFYKGSTKWDVSGQAILPFSDDNAIAPDKVAYLPGSGTTTFAAVSSYSRGINGIVVDLAGTHGTITANDFLFKVGNNNSPSTWATATGPTTVTTRTGAGLGADRIELIWADNAIQKQWLEVIVKGNDALGGSNTNTGLAASSVFIFGNALGDSGAADGSAFSVTSGDEISARNNPKTIGNPATLTDVNDFNRNGLVDSSDQIIARNNSTSLGNQLRFLVVGAGGPFAPQSSARTHAIDSALTGDTGIAAVLAGSQATTSSPTAPAPPPARLTPPAEGALNAAFVDACVELMQDSVSDRIDQARHVQDPSLWFAGDDAFERLTIRRRN
jgi:hypothetical protein